MLKQSDRAIMNNNYYVSNEYKNKQFTVLTSEFLVSNIKCVMLNNLSSCYPINGLTKQ